MPALTRKRIGELARQARRYGYRDLTELDRRNDSRHGHTIAVDCPLCRTTVTAELSQYGRLGTSVTRNLDAAMADHLTDAYADGTPVCGGRPTS